MTWGGVYAESQQRAYGAPWEAATGNEIDWVNYNGGLAEIRAQVTADAVSWDIVRHLCARGAARLPRWIVRRTARRSRGCGPGRHAGSRKTWWSIVRTPASLRNIIWSWVVFGSERTFETSGVTSIAQFFRRRGSARQARPRGFFPSRSLRWRWSPTASPPDEVYAVLDTEAGLDRAFAKLDEIAGHAVFWSSGEEALELVASGEVALSTGYNGRVSERS